MHEAKIQYVTSINDVDKSKVLLLIDASIQAYKAFDKNAPSVCQTGNITPPAGFEFVDSWTGVDSIFGVEKRVECYGVIFRAQTPPYTYAFAFRGTSSVEDMLDDLGAEKKSFSPHDTSVPVPSGVAIESGFFDVYSESASNTKSMQLQLFSLVDRFNASDKPINQLFITGHSLGSALCTLFTLDMALSRPTIKASNYNFASPRVGNSDFVKFFEQQPAQQNAETRTLRIQNTYDKVPCVPPMEIGFRPLAHAYLVAFYKHSLLGKLSVIDCHSAVNYQAVLIRASDSANGVYIRDKFKVHGTGDELTSIEPETHNVCKSGGVQM